MTQPVGCAHFRLLQTAAEELRTARDGWELTERAQALRAAAADTCPAAASLIEEAAESSIAARLFGLADRQLDTMSLEELVSAREELLRFMSGNCSRCDGASPFDSAAE